MTDLKQEKEQLAVLENFFWQKKFSEALVLAEQLNKDFPHSFQINFLYVKILKEEQKWQEAEDVLQQLMSSFPDNVSILKEWADVAFSLRKLEEAEKTYNKILFLDPFNVGAKEALKKLKIMVAPTAPAKPLPEPPQPSPVISRQTISKGDTLPESFFETVPVPDIDEPDDEDLEPDSPLIKDYFEKTDDNININLDDFYPTMAELHPQSQIPDELPLTPETKLPPPPPPEPTPQPKPQQSQPTKAPQLQQEEENDTEFATESAAQLYLSQGLYKEAISIYNKIYRLSHDEKYLIKIENVKSKMVGIKKVERLNHFLELIKREGEKFV